MSRCPYCGLEDDVDEIEAGVPLLDEGVIVVCIGCGGVEIATGVLWETRLPTRQEAAEIGALFEEVERHLGPPFATTDERPPLRRGV